MRGKEQCFVSAVDWLGAAPGPVERPVALGRLALRYLAGHGPASVQDLVKWAGIPLRDARIGLAAIENDIVESPDGTCDLADRQPAAPLPPPRLLGPFDPLLHGWVSRDSVVGDYRGVVTNNGLFRPIALVGGRSVATWGLDGGKITIRLFEPISESVRRALVKDAADVLRYLGLPPTSCQVQNAL
jgi:hypothetical protein